MPLLKDTQLDVFASEGELPEWRCIEWSCANRSAAPIEDYCSLPSVQYSLPPLIKLTTFRISFHLLKDEEGCRMVFGCMRMLFSRIVNTGTITLMVDLDRSLSYVSMSAQNLQLIGKSEVVAIIARHFRAFLVEIGSLRHYALHSNTSLTTNTIETNYHAHALLMVWTTAFKILNLLKGSVVDFELLYPMGNSNPSEQIASLIAYGLMTVSRVTERPFMCKCANIAWQQLYSYMGDNFWPIFSQLFQLCAGELVFEYPTNRSSVIFFELYEARNTIPPQTFLNVFCSLDFRYANVQVAPGKTINSYMEYLRQILLKIDDHRNALIRLYTFFKERPLEELTGAESIVQYYFNLLSAKMMQPSGFSAIYEMSRGSGKVWLSTVKEHCMDDGLKDDIETWTIFIRVACIVCSRCQSVWRSIKSRVFSKFTPKRFREMPISSLVEMLTLFLSFAYSTEISEVCEKTLALVISVFESSDKDRQQVLLHAIHCLILMYRERGLDDACINNSLISMIDKLDEADASGIYVESYLYLAERNLEVISLHRFLQHMTGADIGRILEATAHNSRAPGCLWNVAVERLLTSDSRHSIIFLAGQLRSRCEHNPILASQGMLSISNTLLNEKSAWTNISFEFLIEFFQYFDSTTYFPLESVLPLWLAVAMTQIESDDLIRISRFIYGGFRIFIQQKGFSLKNFDVSDSSTSGIVRWIFELLNGISKTNDSWPRDAAIRWLEPIVSVLQKVLLKSTMEICVHSCRIGSYIFHLVSHLIYIPPSECKFNQSLFVRLCKLYIQNSLLLRNFEASFLDEVVPNYFNGLLALPVASSSYLQRVLIDVVERFCLDYSLKQKMKALLSEHSRVVPVLYAACKANSHAFKFFTAIA